MYAIKRILTLAILVSNTIMLKSQSQLPDEVTATSSYIQIIQKNYAEEQNMAFDLNNIITSATIPVRVHVIKNMKGEAGVKNIEINNSISNANNYFKAIGFRFIIDSLEYINDYNYAFITNNQNKKELLSQFSVKNRINLYLADSILLGSSRSYGYTYFPDAPDSNYIFLDKQYLNGPALLTMLGHYFGLLSTHETAGGQELVNEKNCDSAGDFICDTWADPDLYNQMTDTCIYIGTMKDSNGKFFVPSVANLMSNATDQCRCLFTPLQYRRMYYYFYKYRQYLLSN